MPQMRSDPCFLVIGRQLIKRRLTLDVNLAFVLHKGFEAYITNRQSLELHFL